MGRLLVIPVALSGMCLSMLFGVPMAEAMEKDQTTMEMSVSSAHEMTMSEHLDQGHQRACCVMIRMDHDTKTMTPSPEKTRVFFFVRDIQMEASVWEPADSTSTWIPPGSLSFHKPFFLTGIIFKRE